METSSPPPVPSRRPPAETRRRSIMLKLLVVGALVLVLQVPLLMIRDTLGDRRRFRSEAIGEIAASWGGPQVIVGPLLAVPCTMNSRVERQTLVGDRMVTAEEVREVQGTAWFLPETLGVDGSLDPSERYRGIFRTPVFSARVSISGRFRPDLAGPGLDGATLDWSRASILLGISDARGLRAAPEWRQGERAVAFRPAAPREGWPALIEAPLAIAAPGELEAPFAIELDLQGAPRLAVAPVGAANRISLAGAWRDPSFDGDVLPAWREVTPDGFSARWERSYFGRGYPQQWSERPGRAGLAGGVFERSAVGVTLSTPVDAYRLVERSLKYAFLFVVLVFAVFFLFEVMAGIRVHPLQYVLIGAALTLFYLGFLALGEFAAAPAAYALAAAASTGLVTGYSGSVLRAGRRSLAVGAGLAATYGYLYFILQLQDYALLAGAAALFVLLGAIMWLTRRVDWYALEQPRAATSP